VSSGPADTGAQVSWRCGVLGDPIDHSLSPVLHRAAYAELGLEGWEYAARRVSSGDLPWFLGTLDGSWRGLSLTMPLKREAMPLVVSMSHRAARAGAVNTLVRTTYGWAGDNTDLPGAVNAIRERAGSAAESLRRGVILGAGATAASTGLALVELGVTEITLLARSADRATETASVLAASGCDVLVQPLELRVDADVVVSTLPVEAQTPALLQRWAGSPVVFDVVYDPWPTPLATAAASAGAATVSGLDLLVHQAALQLELFTGRAAPLEQMRAAGEAALAGVAS
jgi:shikimate dehydrogenase